MLRYGLRLWRTLRLRSPLRHGPASRKPVARRRLMLETLEDRTLLSFAAPVALDVGAAPNAVALGHLEGNHAPLDVVTANANGTVSVLLGKGDGSLQNPIQLTVGGNPDAVAVGGFRGNGLQDIAVANRNGTVSVLLSNGDGTFAAPKTISLGATPVGVAVGDFLGNGRLDVVTANSDGSVSLLAGNGDGTFQAPIRSSIGGTFTSVAVADFNGDHKLDLVVGTSTGLDVLSGKGDGSFQLQTTVPFFIHYAGLLIPEAVSSVATADFNGDGKADILAGPLSASLLSSSNVVSVLLGNGDGTFQAPTGLNVGGNVVTSVAVGDFTGDGKLDIATSNAAGSFSGGPSVSVLAGDGNGTFQAPRTTAVGETANALAVGDLHGAGKLDLVLASDLGSNTVAVLPGTGNGTFVVAPTLPVTVLPTAIAAADFNGDGKPDLVATGEGGDAAVLLNNGDGTFHAGPTLTVTGTPDSVATGDFNGDGKQDIAVGTEAGTIVVFLGNGNGTFQAPHVINLGTGDSLRSLVTGDFNHDGRLDLAATVLLPDGLETSVVTVLLGQGNGTFRKSATVKVGTDALGLATADFNGDGRLDLVTTSFLPDGTRDVKVLLGSGTGTFLAPRATKPGVIGRTVATGDFNGDGKPDVVLVDNTDNSVTVLPGNGNGTFGTALALPFDNPTKEAEGVAVGDFFGDGKLSVAVATGLGDVSVLRGNGDGTFQAPVNYLGDFHGQQPAGLVAADFNGDGKPDLAVTNTLTDDVSVLLNTSPKPVTTTPVATTTTLSADADPVVFGQPVTLTATVASGSGTPAGTVSFFDGTTLLGVVAVDPNGHASLQVRLSVGAHSLKASFAGLAPFSASTSAALSETVNRAATTTTLSADSLSIPSNSFVILTATIAPVAPGAGVPTGTVTFFDGTQVVGTAILDANGQAALFVTSLAAGKHTLTASYSGDSNFLASTSAPFVLTVP
jgi:hypothetical protein